MKYAKYSYIYPPRPKNAIDPKELNFWENQGMIAQLKLNGSNTLIFTNGELVRVMGRKGQLLTNFDIQRDEIVETLYKPLNLRGNWLVLNGETLNKSKLDESGVSFNQKFVLFDILVFDSNYLVGKTFGERVQLLDSLYGKINSVKDYLHGISENIYKIKSHDSGFKNLFDTYTKIDMIEGVVLKRRNAKLEIGSGENNNFKSQIKARKPTKLYKF